MVTTSSRCCRRSPPSWGSSSARREVHQAGDDAQEETAVGACLFVSEVEGLVSGFGDTSGECVGEEGEAMTEIRDPKGKRVQDRRTPAQKQADRLVQQGLAPSANAPKLRARPVGTQATRSAAPYVNPSQAQAARTRRAQATPAYVNPGVTRAAGRTAGRARAQSAPLYANPKVAAAVTRKRTAAMPPYASPAQHKLGGGRITGSSKKGKK
jgi:hypothetical protein